MSQLLTVLCAALLAIGFTRWFINWAEANGQMDIPNERSSHDKPVALGGGIVIIAVASIAWIIFAWPLSATYIALLSAALLLALLSWADDRSPLPWWIRLLGQVAAVAGLLWLIPAGQTILPLELPVWLDRLIVALAWIWFINLFNFMDGMDGLASGEAISIAGGIALIHTALAQETESTILALLLTGASLGFIRWNWHQARVFMGDVGSVPIGFLLGWLLIELSLSGAFAAALILPLYFLCDATITLISRIRRGENPLKPHKTHFYQRAHQGGYKHDQVVSRIMLANIVLLGLAVGSISWPWLSTLAAAVTIILLLYVLQQMANGK